MYRRTRHACLFQRALFQRALFQSALFQPALSWALWSRRPFFLALGLSLLLGLASVLLPGVCLSGGSFATAILPAAWADDPAPELDAKAEAQQLAAAMRSKDPEERFEAAEGARTNHDRSLTSPLVRLLSDKNAEVRRVAILALAARELPAARKKASSALVSRLPRLSKQATDKAELLAAIEAIGQLQQVPSIKPLLDPIDGDMEIEEARARINAVAGIPDAESIERLIQFLAKGRRGGRKQQRDAAGKALRWATGERLGHDPDKWRAWWRENKRRFSFAAIAEQREAAEQEKRTKAERRKKAKEERQRKRARKKADAEKAKPKPAGPTD